MGRGVLTLGDLHQFDVVVAIGTSDDGSWSARLTLLRPEVTAEFETSAGPAAGPWRLTCDRTAVLVDINAGHDEFYELTETYKIA